MISADFLPELAGNSTCTVSHCRAVLSVVGNDDVWDLLQTEFERQPLALRSRQPTSKLNTAGWNQHTAAQAPAARFQSG